MFCIPQRYEARRATRHTLRRPIVVHLDKARPNIAQLRDYSATGVGFTSDVELKPGQEFVLNLVKASGDQIPLKFTVVRCMPESGQYLMGARRIEPVIYSEETAIPVQHVDEPVPVQPEHQSAPNGPADAFPIELARGFARAKTIDGKTVCNWDRQLDLRREGDRIWLNMHPPGKTAGWGMFVDRAELIESIETLIDGDPGTMRLSA